MKWVWLSAAALVSLIAIGCVPPEPRQEETGCRGELDCGMGQICVKPTGGCKGRGECVNRPHICSREYRPVCGCDGQAYSNPCMAHAANISIAKDGECP